MRDSCIEISNTNMHVKLRNITLKMLEENVKENVSSAVKKAFSIYV